MGFNSSFGKAKHGKDQDKDAAGKIPGAGKVKKLLGDFDSAVPVLRDLGYELADATIKLGLPPSMVATFEITRQASDDEVNSALRENKGRKLVRMLIQMLSKARKFQRAVHISGLKAKSTAVEIGLMGTGVSLKFA